MLACNRSKATQPISDIARRFISASSGVRHQAGSDSDSDSDEDADANADANADADAEADAEGDEAFSEGHSDDCAYSDANE
jgi:hypothetical protein